MLIELIEHSFLAVLSAMLGASIIFFIKINHNRLCALISLSAGALFGAAVLVILPGAFKELKLWEFALSLGSGYALFYVISKYYFHVCPACAASHFDMQTTKRFSEVARMLFIALSIHAFFDGLAITTGHSHGHHGEESEGLPVLFAIIIHKFPEGLALASLMLGANYPKWKIFVYVFLVELTTVLGTIVGHFSVGVGTVEFWLAFIEAHIAGGFVYLAFHALVGEVLKNHKGLVIGFFVLGMLLISISIFLGGGHAH